MALASKSILISPTPNAPFTATVVTEWKQFLPDGTTQTVKNRRLVARDSSGRIFEERRGFSPNGDKKPTPLLAMDYADPTAHVLYRCAPNPQRCQALSYNAPPVAQPANDTALKNLGQKKIDNLDTTGSRQVITVATTPGSGKETVELWFSPKLQINLTEKHATDTDNLIFTVEGINLSDPDPKLFTPSTTASAAK